MGTAVLKTKNKKNHFTLGWAACHVLYSQFSCGVEGEVGTAVDSNGWLICFLFVLHFDYCGRLAGLSSWPRTAYAEIDVPSAENPELAKVLSLEP